MAPDLTSCLAKLKRAEYHFELVNGEVKPWTENHPYRFIHQRNPDFTEYTLRVAVDGPLPDFTNWSLGIGDAIANLRDSLDHLIYAVDKFETRHDLTAKIDALAFLIVDNEAQFWGDSKRRLKGLSPGVIQAVEAFQPYNRPNPAVRPFLGILRDLSNANKHRFLQMAAGAASEWNIHFRSPMVSEEPGVMWVNLGEIEDGSVLCSFRTPFPAPDLKFHSGYIDISPCLWHGAADGDTTPCADRSPYSTLVRLMLAEVKAVIHAVRSSSAAV